MRFNTIIKNFNLLNLMLLAIIFVFVGYVLSPMLKVDTRITLLPAKKTTGEEKANKTSENKIPSPLDFNVIAENNLFHPERIIPIDKKAEAPLPKPDFILYGTLITDDLRIAYIEDLKAPRSTPGRGKRVTSLKKDAMMSGFTLKEVETDKVVMARGEESVIVKMNDPAHAKKRTEAIIVSTAQVEPRIKPIEPAKAQQVQQLPAEQTPISGKKGATPESQPATPNVFENFLRGIQGQGK